MAKNLNKENEFITPEVAASNKAFHREASEELVEAVSAVANEKLGVDLTTEDITGMKPADICDTLFQKVIDGELFKGEYNLYLVSIFEKIMVRLGNKEYKYGMLDDRSGDLDIQADNSIEDFNGEYIAEYAELFKTDRKFHKKVKVPQLILSNAWVSAENMVEFVQLQVESMYKALARRYENALWTKVFNEAYTVEVPNGSEAIEYSRKLVDTVSSLETTSNAHECIGTNGVITINTTQGNKTVQPDLSFSANEFHLFIDKSQFVNETFDNEAQWYNYAVTKQAWKSVKVVDFSKYAGFRAIKKQDDTAMAPAVTVPTGLKMVAIHEDFLQMLEQYTYSEVLSGRGPWTMSHTHTKFDVYRVKTKPCILITEAAVVEG